MNRLYVFYNIEVSKEGAPFAMCDECKKNYRSFGKRNGRNAAILEDWL